jgi:hypothetical protein
MDEVMCPTCNVAMVDGACPQCGAKAEEATSAPEVTEEATEETPAE